MTGRCPDPCLNPTGCRCREAEVAELREVRPGVLQLQRGAGEADSVSRKFDRAGWNRFAVEALDGPKERR
jgi:hypothetical protein